MLSGVILAAGLSSRMGRIKPLLKINSTSFIRNIIASMRAFGIDEIIVVTGHAHEELLRHLEDTDMRVVYNPDYAVSDMFHSIVIGLNAVSEGSKGVFLTPADIPLPGADVYESIMTAAAGFETERIIIPAYQGRHGHPIYIPKACFAGICAHESLSPQRTAADGLQDAIKTVADGSQDAIATPGGLKGVIAASGYAVEYVEVETDVILQDADTPEDYLIMNRPISAAIERVDHKEKITGSVKYVRDYSKGQNGEEILTGRIIRSTMAHAYVKKMNIPDLPEGYYFIGAKDVPRNLAIYPLADIPGTTSEELKNKLLYDAPLFADKEVKYYGEPMGVIAGPDEATVRELVSKVSVEYEELPAIINMMDVKEPLMEFDRELGDYKTAFEEADEIFEEEFDTGVQYQSPIEPQGLMAEREPDGRICVHGSLQCPFQVRDSIACMLDTAPENVVVRQDATGGGFGGKQDFPTTLGCAVAASTYVTGKNVRITLDRSEDIQFASKRHPSHSKVKIAVRNGAITAMDVLGTIDAGANTTSSPDVAILYFQMCPGIYAIPNFHIHVNLVKTNLPPNGAFRGFGNPQNVFAIEMAMSHLAKHLNRDELEFKREYMAKDGGLTSTGGTYKEHVPIEEMLNMAMKATDYTEKRAAYSKPQSGRYRRGIGLCVASMGCTIGGEAEWDGIKATPKLVKHADGTVSVYTAQTEMGQGIRTAFTKIVANVLDIPTSKVFVGYPDSDLTHDTGITAASRSTVIVGRALYDAAMKLKENYIEGVEQEFEATIKRPAKLGDFDEVRNVGDCFAHYLWNTTVLEVMVDTITGKVKIMDAYGVYNIGTPIDINIARGQMEGGLMQGIGYAAFERLVYGPKGKIFNTAFSDYHIPTFVDVPSLRVEFEYSEYEEGPFGAKGAGELPIPGVGAAYLNALEQALDCKDGEGLNHIPFVSEDVIMSLRAMRENHDLKED